VCSAEALARHLFATWPPLSSRGLCPTYREVCRPSSQAIPGQSAIGSSQL
jgi:hypothetical protein